MISPQPPNFPNDDTASVLTDFDYKMTDTKMYHLAIANSYLTPRGSGPKNVYVPIVGSYLIV